MYVWKQHMDEIYLIKYPVDYLLLKENNENQKWVTRAAN